MADEQERLTPQERLAISRHALLEQWGALAPANDAYEAPYATHPQDMLPGASAPASPRGFPWKMLVQDGARRWWRRHPANAATVLLRPALERQARDHPLQLVATAAAVGAIVVLAKPWRLLSATAIAAALFKSSDVADVVTTLMRRVPPPRKDMP